MNQRRGRHGPPRPSATAAEETEDVKTATVTDRRVLRSHYRRLKASIAEEKEHLLSGDSDNFDAIVRRADDLHCLVHRPREQIADAEALLDITEAFLNSVKDSRRRGAVKAADLVSAIIQKFGHSANLDNDETIQLDWAAIGLEANAIFNDAPGMCTMLGPMDSEPKKRKAAAPRRREKGPVTETTRPQTVGEGAGDESSETDKIIRVMFNVLRRCGEKGCELEHLVLNRDSFSETVENIFFLSFLVKDGRAQITIKDGKHFVAFRYAPTAAERSGRSEGAAESHQVVNSQFVFRFDFKDWMMMKEMVEEGKEIMPKRSQPLPPPTSATPIRKTSRNRGRVTLPEMGDISIQLGDCEDSEAAGEDENDCNTASIHSTHPVKKRILGLF